MQQGKNSYRERAHLVEHLNTQMQKRDWENAFQTADQLLQEGISDRETFHAVLATYIDGGDVKRAMKAVEQYIKTFSVDGRGCFYLGLVKRMEGDWEGAEKSFSLALQDESLASWYQGAVYSILGTLYREEGRVADAVESYRRAIEKKSLKNGRITEYSNYLFDLHYLSKNQSFMLQAAKGYGALLADILQMKHDHYRHHKKLRIGYASPDLHFHVVMFFSYAFFHNYDRTRFEVYCYTDCVEDKASREICSLVDGWRNVRGLIDHQIAELIRQDEIDVLIDLAGHTAWNMLQVFAYKPAPVQLSGIGYFDTTGLPAMDYFLADSYTDPLTNDAFFTEKLLRMDNSHFCFMWHDAPGSVQPAPFQWNGFITFGSFNNFSKVTDRMLSLWREILLKVPNSRLYLKASIFNNDYGRKLAEERLVNAGISLERVIEKKHEIDYLTAYHEIDIALDTYPYPGGGTTCDALYMGVPIITLVGERHNARFGYSLLMNIGLPEYCAFSEEDYVSKVVQLAQNPIRLKELRQTMRWRMCGSPVMQAEDYMAELEQHYEHIWSDWQYRDESEADRRARIVTTCRKLEKYVSAGCWQDVLKFAPALVVTSVCPSIVWSWIGLAYHQIRDWGRAAWWLRQAAQHDVSRDAENYRLLAESEARRYHYVASQQAAEQALTACSSNLRKGQNMFLADIYAILGATSMKLGDLGRAEQAYHQAAQLAGKLDDQCNMYSSWLFARFDSIESGEERIQGYQGYNQLFSSINPYGRPHPRRHSRLRIGYISPDFRQHVMFYFYYQLLAAHSAEKFEVYLYSLGKTQDAFTEMVKKKADHFRDVSGKPYERIAHQVYADEIDILIDLAGHTAESGLPVLAWRPAALQITGLGYPDYTGLGMVDYYLTDQVIDTPDNQIDRKGLVEKPLYLPSQFCYTGRNDLPQSDGAPGQRNGYLTLGCFNQYRKLTDEMLLVWKDIMQCLPESRLLLKDSVLVDDAAALEIHGRLIKLGMDMDRIVLEPASENYMERYLDVDIALDTYPYTGGGTTCDALYMGVPVVSRYGHRRGTRFGLSILEHAGLAELAAADIDGYRAKVLALADDKDLLDTLHRNLRTMLLNSILMDTNRYVKSVEDSLYQIWQEKVGLHV